MKTVSLELAKRINELGWFKSFKIGQLAFVNEGLVMITELMEASLTVTACDFDFTQIVDKDPNVNDIYLAPNLTEILEELPWGYHLVKADTGFYYIGASSDRGSLYKKEKGIHTSDLNPAEAAGLLWCKLKEEKII